MEPMRLLVTDAAAQPPRQATAWLIMTLGRISNPMKRLRIPLVPSLLFSLYVVLTLELLVFVSLMEKSIKHRFVGFPLPSLTWLIVMDLRFLFIQPIVALLIAAIARRLVPQQSDANMVFGITLAFCASVIIFLVVMASVSPWLPLPTGLR